MVITMLITIYSSRIVLQALEVEGFGTYNIIYGITALFLFIQSSLNTSTLRFISNSIVTSDKNKQIVIFNSSFQVTIILLLLTFILLETIGLYIVNDILKIGVEYKSVANICYQYCIVSYLAQTLRIPFVSLIISHERMSVYAILSVVESIFKLIIAYLLVLNQERLVYYCFYLFISTLLCSIITIIYCVIKFPTCRVLFKRYDKDDFKDILSFSSWTTLSSFSNSMSQQGGNILMNIYSGVVANAAWGIAHQVNTAFAALASSLQNAFTPQINKSYAENDLDGLLSLLNRASAIAYYLVLLIGVPIICNIDFILQYWLITPPYYANSFCICIIIFQMIDTMQAPFNTLIFATGKVKFYNIWLSAILILNIIISAICLSNGFSPVCVPLTMLGLNAFTGILRFLHIIHILQLNVRSYFYTYLTRMFLVTVICFICSFLLTSIFDNDFVKIILSIIVTVFIICVIGVTKEDKTRLYRMLTCKF